MREIKFRAWDKKEKKMYDVYAISFPEEKSVVVTRDDGKSILAVPNNQIELLQFTGLKDKNGKEIFEGDIVGYWDNACWEVLYVAEKGAFRFGNRISHFPIGELRRKEVIGNIYENTDLLSEEK